METTAPTPPATNLSNEESYLVFLREIQVGL